jgi:hypothetical protein
MTYQPVGCGDEGTASFAGDAVPSSPHPTALHGVALEPLINWLERQNGAILYVHSDGRITLRLGPFGSDLARSDQEEKKITGQGMIDTLEKARSAFPS